MDTCHSNYCIWDHVDADDEDYCFSPAARFHPHAKCKDRPASASTPMNDSYMESLREIRDMFFPFFTLIQMEMYIDTYPPPSEEDEPYDDDEDDRDE
jgi:hypothetical protein